jgi:hypothetical protein
MFMATMATLNALQRKGFDGDLHVPEVLLGTIVEPEMSVCSGTPSI